MYIEMYSKRNLSGSVNIPDFGDYIGCKNL